MRRMATQTQRRFLRADLNPTRTVCLERLERPAVCHRTTLWRTSCGRPDPSSRRCLRGHDRMCPALSGRPPCRWSRCRATIIVFQQAVHRYSEVEASRPYEMALAPLQRLRQVAASPTPTACLDRLRRPIACPRTTHWRTSCGQPDAAKGVALGAVAGYVRHCGRHDAV